MHHMRISGIEPSSVILSQSTANCASSSESAVVSSSARVISGLPHIDNLLSQKSIRYRCNLVFAQSLSNFTCKLIDDFLDISLPDDFNLITNIKSFDFSTLYTTIPHQKLKSRLASIIRNSFLHKNGNRRYKYLVLGREGPYFVKEH